MPSAFVCPDGTDAKRFPRGISFLSSRCRMCLPSGEKEQGAASAGLRGLDCASGSAGGYGAGMLRTRGVRVFRWDAGQMRKQMDGVADAAGLPYGDSPVRKENRRLFMTDRDLIFCALQARRSAYAPYSGFAVGAALLCRDGSVYTGCNIENAAFTPTVCAERTAFFKAISAGKREFDRIAVCGYRIGEAPGTVCTPCGVCRQVMAEFCDPDRFEVICCGGALTDSSVWGLLRSGTVLTHAAETPLQAEFAEDREAEGSAGGAVFPEEAIPEEIYAEKYLLRALFPHGFSGSSL